jgi:hypothetical protein
LTVNSGLLFVDLVVVPEVDLAPWRSLVALAALSILVFGLVWDSN